MVFNAPFIAVFISVAIGVVLAHPGPGGSDKIEPRDESEWPRMQMLEYTKCAGADIKFPKFDNIPIRSVVECQMKMYSNVSSESSHKEFLERMCAGPICIAQQFGLIDLKGKPIVANITTQIQAVAPSNKVTNLTSAITACIDKHSGKVDVTQCDTYSDLFKCIHTDVSKVCEWKQP